MPNVHATTTEAGLPLSGGPEVWWGHAGSARGRRRRRSCNTSDPTDAKRRDCVPNRMKSNTTAPSARRSPRPLRHTFGAPRPRPPILQALPSVPPSPPSQAPPLREASPPQASLAAGPADAAAATQCKIEEGKSSAGIDGKSSGTVGVEVVRDVAPAIGMPALVPDGQFRSSPTNSPLRYGPIAPMLSPLRLGPGGVSQGPGGDWSPEEAAWMRDAELNVLMPDTELCNPGQTPVRAVGIVIASYNFLQHHILRRFEWVVRRTRDEYTEEGRRFWTEKAGGADQYFEHAAQQLEPADAARQMRQFLDRCWSTIPRLSILIDDIHSDCTLLNQFLGEHGHRALNYDVHGNYRRTIYVSRDLMRGAFSMLQSNFVDLHCSDLYLAIHRYWQQLVALQPQPQVPAGWAPLWTSATDQDSRRLRKAIQPPACAQPVAGLPPDVKHLPVWDAMQTLIVFFRMEDIKRWFHSQLAKLLHAFPSALVLPKSGLYP